MFESKKGIHQIAPNNFLFFISPEIAYTLSFEIVESQKIRINLVKISESNTYIFTNVVPYTDFGKEEPNPQETIKNLSIIIFNHNFKIKEESNKSCLLLFSK